MAISDFLLAQAVAIKKKKTRKEEQRKKAMALPVSGGGDTLGTNFVNPSFCCKKFNPLNFLPLFSIFCDSFTRCITNVRFSLL